MGRWYRKIGAQVNVDGIDPENDDGKVHFSIQAAKKNVGRLIVNTTHPLRTIKKKKQQFLKYPTENYFNYFYSPR